jgi:IclR family acetate operon transcriptional repressor
VIENPPVRLGDRLIAIVESFLAAPSQTLTDVSTVCGMEPSTTIRYLRLLMEHDWLERDEPTRTYSLGVRLATIGHAARSAGPLRQRVAPHMQDLVKKFDETVNLAVHQSGAIVIIEAFESGRSIRRGASIGDRDDWFSSSLGKAILAFLPDNEIVDIFATHRPVRHTENTLVTLDAVRAELDVVRDQGYALDNEEAEIGLKCVGVAIRDHLGVYSHALSISGPTWRMDQRLDSMIDELQQVARIVSDGEREVV